MPRTRRTDSPGSHLNVCQWYALLKEGHQLFPPRLQPHELAHQRAHFAPWLSDLEMFLAEHPVDPREVNTLSRIRDWAAERAIPLAEAGSGWPQP
jgi:hypothetical protein